MNSFDLADKLMQVYSPPVLSLLILIQALWVRRGEGFENSATHEQRNITILLLRTEVVG
jgi:hypothetical protein